MDSTNRLLQKFTCIWLHLRKFQIARIILTPTLSGKKWNLQKSLLRIQSKKFRKLSFMLFSKIQMIKFRLRLSYPDSAMVKELTLRIFFRIQVKICLQHFSLVAMKNATLRQFQLPKKMNEKLEKKKLYFSHSYLF